MKHAEQYKTKKLFIKLKKYFFVKKTRLNSIVSNPIKVMIVVVVIVVVVLVEKNYVQKNFDPKTFHVQKTLGLKM